jgi:hypothetical protein
MTASVVEGRDAEVADWLREYQIPMTAIASAATTARGIQFVRVDCPAFRERILRLPRDGEPAAVRSTFLSAVITSVEDGNRASGDFSRRRVTISVRAGGTF